jgi:hypothetical protein
MSCISWHPTLPEELLNNLSTNGAKRQRRPRSDGANVLPNALLCDERKESWKLGGIRSKVMGNTGLRVISAV